MHPNTKFGIPTSKNVRDRLWTQLFLKLGRSSRSRLQWPENEMWHSVISRCNYTPNLEFLSQEYRSHAPDSMQFLKTRSEVKFKVTVTQFWYVTLCHPKMHPHTKCEIPTSNNIRDMLRIRLILKTRSEVKVKVTVTQKWYAALYHPKMYLHFNLEFLPQRMLRDRLWTQ